MNGPVSLLHVVGREKVGDASQTDQEVILKTKDGRRPYDGRLGEDAPGYLLSPSLGGKEAGLGVGVGVVGGHVDVAVDVVLGHGLDNPLCSLNVDILQAEVLGRVIPADEVIDNIGMSNARFDGLGVSQIVF